MATENLIVNPYSGYLEGESARCFDEGVAAERARITSAIENASRHGAAAERARIIALLRSNEAVKIVAHAVSRLMDRDGFTRGYAIKEAVTVDLAAVFEAADVIERGSA